MEESGVKELQRKVLHRRFKGKEDLYLVLLGLVKDLEKMANPLENTLRYVIIDSFSLAFINRAGFDFWVAELTKLIRILNTRYYIGVLVQSP